MGRFFSTNQGATSPLGAALQGLSSGALTGFQLGRQRRMDEEQRQREQEARQYELEQRPLREALQQAQARSLGIVPQSEATDTTFQIPAMGPNVPNVSLPATVGASQRFKPLGPQYALDTFSTPEARQGNERIRQQRLADAIREQENARQDKIRAETFANQQTLENLRHTNRLSEIRTTAELRPDPVVKPTTPLSGEARGRTILALPRMEESNKVLDAFAAPPARTLLSKITLGNYGLTPEEQVFQNAAENFVNGVLRTESGATVTEEEREAAIRALVPQPGDKPEVIAQKKLMRQRVLETFRSGAGVQSQQYSPDNPFAPR